MKKNQIDGIATFNENGQFTFDSGLPTSEPVLDAAKKLRGTLSIERNANAEFKPDNHGVSVAPQLNIILHEGNLRVHRTTKNFIVTMKFPIVETDESTATTEKSFWKKAKAVIAKNRKDIKETF